MQKKNLINVLIIHPYNLSTISHLSAYLASYGKQGSAAPTQVNYTVLLRLWVKRSFTSMSWMLYAFFKQPVVLLSTDSQAETEAGLAKCAGLGRASIGC